MLLLSTSLSAIALFLLADRQWRTPTSFAQGYDNLLIPNGAGRPADVRRRLAAWRPAPCLKKGVFGLRLACALVLLFALVAILPGALVYAVSVQFIGRSIESWFDVRVDRPRAGGRLRWGRSALITS